MKDILARPATGLVVGSAITALIGSRDSTKIFGMSVPTYIAGGLSTAAAVELQELAHSYVFPNIPITSKYSHTESMILGPIMGGLIFYGLLRAADPDRYRGVNMLGAAGVGAANVVATDYAYSAFVEPYIHSRQSMIQSTF